MQMPVSPCARGGARSTRGASILFSPSPLNYRLPRLFALGGKLRCLMRLALFTSRAQSESRPSDRLWLLPWHVPPLSPRN